MTLLTQSIITYRHFGLCRNVHKLFSLQQKATSVAHGNVLEGKPLSEVPGPFCFPLIGNLWQYKFGIYNIGQYHKVLRSLYERYGPVVRERLGPRTIIHLFDPDDVRQVHGAEGKMPEIPPLQETTQFYRKQKGMSPGLGNTNGEEWYRLRSSIQQMMMKSKEVSFYLPLVEKVASDFLARIASDRDSNGELPDLQQLVAKWSLESSTMLCTETKFGSLAGGETERTGERMIEANKIIFELSGRLKFSLPLYKYFNTPRWKRLIESEDFFYSVAMEKFESTLSHIDQLIKKSENLDGRYSFLTYLLSRSELSHKDILIITFSMFADGLSTTNPTMSNAIWCLARYPEVQQRLYEEVRNKYPLNDNVSYEVINTWKYMRAFIKEVLRLFPVGTEVSRNLPRDMVLGGYLIPKGTHVDLNQSIHLRSNWFHDPDKFQPERWIDLELRRAVHPYLHIPFGHGIRMCAGRRFAEQDMTVVLGRLLQRYRLEVVPNTPDLGQKYRMLLVPDAPIKVRFFDR